MDFFSGSGSRKYISFRLGKEMSGPPNQVTTEAMEIDVPTTDHMQELEVTEIPVDKGSVAELSSNTDTESCEAYISRTVELLASVESITTIPNEKTPAQAKTSINDHVAITPGLNELIPEDHEPDDVARFSSCRTRGHRHGSE